MEMIAWASHKYVMHGFGWGWHRSHHEPRDGALERHDDLVHADLVGGAREAVPAVGSARALDELGLLQQRDDALTL